MSMDTFKKAVQYAKDHSQSIVIGGGEPTLHPQFKDFLMHSIWELSELFDTLAWSPIYLVTNGSNTEISLTLAKLAKQGIIEAAVSSDIYHDPIDEKVIEAFQKNRSTLEHALGKDGRHINEIRMPVAVGRARKEVDIFECQKGTCACSEVFISPKGTIFPCGCRVKSIGNIHSCGEIPLEYFDGVCQRDTVNFKKYVLDQLKPH